MSTQAERKTPRSARPARTTACALLILVLVSCGGGTDPSAAAKKKLRFAMPGEPQTLDPALMTGLSEINLATDLFEGLMRFDPKGGDPLPGVAETFEVSPDALVYTFHLRKCAWSDGSPLTARDFVTSWRRVLEPVTASKYAGQLYCIEGARAFNAGEEKDFSKVMIEAVDDATLKVRLHAPTPHFPFLVASPVYAPVHAATVEKFKDRWTLPENIVSNGPFVLKEHRLNSVIRLERNPRYWDTAAVKLDTIEAMPVEHDETAFSMYEVGDLDWLRTIPFSKVERVSQRVDFCCTQALETVFLRLNVSTPPFDDPRVRKAFAAGTDQEAICAKLLKSGQQPARCFVPPVLWRPASAPGEEQGASTPDLATPCKGIGFDPSEAKRLLKEAGYPEGHGFPEVTLIYSTSENIRLVVELLQWQWKQNLGVRVSLVNMERKAYFEAMKERRYNLAYSSWVGDYPDPQTFLDVFRSDSGTNRTGWSNAEYDRLVTAAGVELDKEKRRALFAQAERLLVEDECPAVMLYFGSNSFLLNKKVKGVSPNALGLYPLRDAALE
ncbi:MAG: peptide ABC transporter substrate-binding protein [Planctomycetota bacterium]|nr:peptide ABC transporter substrate-binding protein [Planctomycetota bacterium]